MRDNNEMPRRGAPDFQLLILTLLLVGFGVVMVFSSSSSITLVSERFEYDPMYFTKRQLIFGALGLFGMLITMNIPYEKYKKLFIPVFILAIILLMFVPFVGAINGASSWITLGKFGIQPTELAKVT